MADVSNLEGMASQLQKVIQHLESQNADEEVVIKAKRHVAELTDVIHQLIGLSKGEGAPEDVFKILERVNELKASVEAVMQTLSAEGGANLSDEPKKE